MGESNGGQLIHYLVRQLPGLFLGVVPVFGLPELGYLLGDKLQLLRNQTVAARTSVLALHDRSDTVEPPGGGVNQWGWLFESLGKTMGVYAALKRCAPEAKPIKTPQDGDGNNLACAEYLGCAAGGRVVSCMYDGTHGQWPKQPGADTLIWAFFSGLGPG